MPNPLLFFRCVGRAAANFFGGGIAGDVVFEVLPELAGDVWKWWQGARDADQRRQDLAALAAASPAHIQEEIRAIVAEVVAQRPSVDPQALELFLSLVPGQVRKSLRRPSDPEGHTVAFEQEPHKADDLIPLLPARLPRFKPGDRPLLGVDWELEELLGIGGFGEVWKARNPWLTNVPPVALKFCLDPSAARYLRNEAAILDRVMRQGRHPGIVTLQHTYLTSETPCLEYEFISGGDLAGLIREWHRLPNRPTALEMSRVLHQLALIVGFAHQLEPPIVHRDLKPANVLIHGGPSGVPQLKVADFGIGGVAARQTLGVSTLGTTRGLFLATALRGSCTPLYASPQQLRGESPDPSDDVYALGVIWYQMLTGDLTAGRPGGTRWQRRLRELGLDDQLTDVLGRCFEDDPTDRLPTANALADELGALLPSRRADSAHRARLDAVQKVKKLTSTIQTLPRSESASPPPPSEASAPRMPTPRPPESELRRRELLQRDLTELEQRLAHRPGDWLVLAQCAEVRRQLGDHDNAIRDATEAIRLDPTLARAYSTRGSSYRLKGQFDLAIADCSEAIRLDPANVLAYFNRGEAFRLRREIERAIADFTRALEIDRNYAWALGSRGAARQQKSDLAGALEDLNRTVELEPGYAWAYVVRAETHRLLGDHERTIADCNEALRLQPDSYTAWATRGAAFRLKGDFTTASADLQQALQLKPDYQWAREQLELARRRYR
ncbi:MAG: serine/threonine-protein kinase [Gemmataceae bacterium]